MEQAVRRLFFALASKKGMYSDRQAIDQDCGCHDGIENGTVNVRLLKGDIERKPRWLAATAVFELESI